MCIISETNPLTCTADIKKELIDYIIGLGDKRIIDVFVDNSGMQEQASMARE